MVSKEEIQQIKKIILANHTFVLTTHHNPDGDALGSEIAMAEYLRSLGKEVSIVNNSSTPNNYKFLDENEKILIYNSDEHHELVNNADAYFILDISDWERLRELGSIIKNSSAPKVCIDHHFIDYQFTDIDIIYKDASSTGELLYEIFSALNCEFTSLIATALYTCILTDTGSFRFSNTTANTHGVASKLLAVGVKTKEIYSLVYEQNSKSKMALMGDALGNLKYECDGKLAWFVLNENMFKKYNASHWDTEGFPEIPRTIEGVEVSLMFTEIKKNKIKVSLRSKGKIIISEIARKFGGGGHNFAAGAQVEKTLDQTIPLVLTDVKNLVCNSHKLEKNSEMFSG